MPVISYGDVDLSWADVRCWSFLQTVGNKCFDKCVTKPGSSLSGSESSCISRCVDRYIEATGIVSRALFSSQRWSSLYKERQFQRSLVTVVSPWDFWLVRMQWHFVLDCSKNSAYRLGGFLVLSLSALVAKEKRALFNWLRCLLVILIMWFFFPVTLHASYACLFPKAFANWARSAQL